MSAVKYRKLEMNAPGTFYVDDSCVDCQSCVEAYPQFFAHDEKEHKCYIYRQPETPEEIALMHEAMENCPTLCLGDDGDFVAQGADI
jgi:ferredoxin